MLNVNMIIIKRSIEKKKYPQAVNILKKFIKTTTITKYSLDLEVNFTIGNLLAFVPVVEKQLIKTIFKNKAVQFYVNILSLVKAFEITTSYFWYSMRLFKVKIYLKDVSKVTVFLNTSAKFFVIIKKLIKDANLVMR